MLRSSHLRGMRICAAIVGAILLGGCGGRTRLSSDRIETATRQTIVEEIERVHRSGAGESPEKTSAYLEELEVRLKFIDPFFTGAAGDPASFRAALLDAERGRVKSAAGEIELSRKARQAPAPGAVLSFSESEVRRHLELLERGEFSGGYSDEDLREYGGAVAAQESDPSGNLTARDEFRRVLKMRLCDFYPEWGQTGREAILEGRVFPGMSREAVIASWGYPNAINRLNRPGVEDEEWIYEGSRKLLVRDGRLLRLER